MRALLEKISDVISNRKQAVLCTIVSTKGSTPLKAGARMLVYEDGSIYGTVGGGTFEKSVIEQSGAIIESQESQLIEHHLTKDHEMCCGGTVSVYMEPIPIPYQLFIFGAGHVSKALSDLTSNLEFDVKVIDDRAEIFNDWKRLKDDPNIDLINKHHGKVIPSLQFDERTLVVIVTYSHPLDREILAQTIKKNLGYVGMIGSKRKVAITRKIFLEQGIADQAQLDKVDMPIGIDIKAHSPYEIAVSILAGLINARNEKNPGLKAGLSIEQLEGSECFDKIDKKILKEILGAD